MEFRTFFEKDGIRYNASDYGYKAWPIRVGSRRTKKANRSKRKA